MPAFYFLPTIIVTIIALKVCLTSFAARSKIPCRACPVPGRRSPSCRYGYGHFVCQGDRHQQLALGLSTSRAEAVMSLPRKGSRLRSELLSTARAIGSDNDAVVIKYLLDMKVELQRELDVIKSNQMLLRLELERCMADLSTSPTNGGQSLCKALHELTIDEVGCLLTSLDFSEYIDVFRSNRISGALLYECSSVEELVEVGFSVRIKAKLFLRQLRSYRINRVPVRLITTSPLGLLSEVPAADELNISSGLLPTSASDSIGTGGALKVLSTEYEREQLPSIQHESGASGQIAITDFSVMKTLAGHSEWVNDIVQLADGRICSSSGDKSVRIWDSYTGRCESILEGHDSSVLSVIQLGDGRLCSGSDDFSIKIWDVGSGRCEQTWVGHSGPVLSVSELRDGRVCSASEDRTIKIWNLVTGACEQTLEGHSDWVFSVLELQDGRICSGSEDSTIRLWDCSTGHCEKVLVGHLSYVLSVIQLQDGRLCSSSGDKSIRIWDPSTGRCDRVLQGHGDGVNAVIQLRDGRLCSGSDDDSINIWGSDGSGMCDEVLEGHRDCVNAVIELRDGRLCSASEDKTIKIWG